MNLDVDALEELMEKEENQSNEKLHE